MPAGAPPPLPEADALAVLPLRNSVLFPTSVVPINVGRRRSVRLVEDLMGRERALLGVFAQRSPNTDDPGFDDLYEVGTLARVVQIHRSGPTSYTVRLEGLARLRVVARHGLDPYLRVRAARVVESRVRNAEMDALGATLRESARELCELQPAVPRELAPSLDNVRDAGALADRIAASLGPDLASVPDKQAVLEAFDPKQRVRLAIALVDRHLSLLRAKKQVSSMVEDEMGKSEREHVLRQQMRAIQSELGEGPEDDELEELRERLRRAGLPPEAEKAARKQLGRLSTMHQQSAEYNVTRTYLEWIADLPWSTTTPDRIDVAEVRRCLDEDHYGLDKVKRRIVEYVAVRKLRADKKGPILCFIGPPGVGKTSLGRSIARSMGRRYGRIALGGVRDEADVRGHRRTYVGALPGRIIQGIKKVGARNPVLVLDEVDKLGIDLRGDPAAALLEVLDPEQNATFQDHYIDLPFDLSQVVFLATANNHDTIPPALLDRMEVIDVAGYTRTDKLCIARAFLIPKQRSEHGLTVERLDIADEAVEDIIDHYTKEAGVRNLEREIAALCRHVAVRLVEGEDVHERATPDLVEKVLGPRRHKLETIERSPQPGVAVGLAWTPTGGEVLFVEATKMPGQGKITLTGNMRNVMQESATTAISFVRSRAERLLLDPEWLKSIDLHVHIPQAGMPKDGPSHGLSMFAAVASLLLGCPVKGDVAMVGEITLRGNVLPVEGVKERLLAAHRAGLRTVLLPHANERDLEEVPKEVLEHVEVKLVRRLDEVLGAVLGPPAPVAPSEPPRADPDDDEGAEAPAP